MELYPIGEAIDRLVTVPMSNWTILKGLPLQEIYETARKKAGEPIVLKAAKLLSQRVEPGDTVLILTGFVIKNWGLPETDGPVGAAALARSLDLSLGAVPVLLTDDVCVPCVRATTESGGMILARDMDDVRYGGRGRKALVYGFPMEHEAAKAEALRLLDELKPKAVIAVERPGWNEKHIHHSGMGYNISDVSAKLDYLYEEAMNRGILTIGIGDLGNEMGMGYVKEAVRAKIPNAERCLCGCGGGIACDLGADVGLICNISNWGAYGICAMLAALCGEPEVLHDPATERRMIEACVAAGALDPFSGLHRPWVDGESEDIHADIIELLNTIVAHATTGSYFTRGYQDTWKHKIENL